MIINLSELAGNKSESALAAISYLEAYQNYETPDLEMLSLMHKNLKHTDLIKGMCFTSLMLITYLSGEDNVVRYVVRLGMVLSEEGETSSDAITILNLLLASQQEDLTDFHLTLHTIEDTVQLLMCFAGFNQALLNRNEFLDKAKMLTDLKQSLLDVEIAKLNNNN